MQTITRILAADIGGTKTLLQFGEFANERYQLINEQRFNSQDYASFNLVLTDFFNTTSITHIDHACFAIAGPVELDGSSAKVTNLPWCLNRSQLLGDYDIQGLTLINDFHAVALGIDTLTSNEYLPLQNGTRQNNGAQLIIGAGTGLGVAHRIWQGDHYHVLASEAGHAGFSPANKKQQQLYDFISQEHAQVSREKLLSGQGLVNIYHFICRQKKYDPSHIDAAQISQLAQQNDSSCKEALALFFDIYGSECGNLALTSLPYGGIYIAGGIAAKNTTALLQSTFIQAFSDKGKMSALLKKIPIHVIKNESVGLQGARRLACLQR